MEDGRRAKENFKENRRAKEGEEEEEEEERAEPRKSDVVESLHGYGLREQDIRG